MPVNLPLPTKIVTQVLPPIDITARFGTHPDVEEVDGHIRWVMQSVLDELGRRRWFPILG
jgi:SH3-like domain-containing protein